MSVTDCSTQERAAGIMPDARFRPISTRRPSGRMARRPIDADDVDAMAHLGARRGRQIFRGPRRLHDRRRHAADRGRIQHHQDTAWRDRRGEPVRHPRRRHRPRRPVGLFRPQGHVHRGDGYFYRLPLPARGEPELYLAGRFPVRPRRRAWLRLSDRPFDHFRKHPEPACAGASCSARSAFRRSAR